MNDPISDERLEELYEIFADRAAEPTTGMKEDIDVMLALAELQERRAAEPQGVAGDGRCGNVCQNPIAIEEGVTCELPVGHEGNHKRGGWSWIPH